MSSFLAQFPFSEDPKRFQMVLTVAGGITVVALILGARFAPIPAQPMDALPERALLALTVPPGDPFTGAATTADAALTDEAAALRRFAASHPAIARALTAPTGGRMVLFSNSASGTAQFLLDVSGTDLDATLLIALAQTAPAEKPLWLPDRTAATALVADPAALETLLERVPGTEWLALDLPEGTLSFRTAEDGLSFTTIPPEILLTQSFRPASQSFCLSGQPAAVPGVIPSRWQRLPAPVPGFALPMLFPRMKSVALVGTQTVEIAHFCRK